MMAVRLLDFPKNSADHNWILSSDDDGVREEPSVPVEVKYLNGGKGVMFIASGFVTGEELITASKEIFSRDIAEEPYLYGLVDFNDVDGVNVSTAEVRRIADLDLRASKHIPKAVVGIYAKNDLAFGLGRMWEVFIADAGWDTKVFRSRPDAVAWVRQRVFETFGLHISLG